MRAWKRKHDLELLNPTIVTASPLLSSTSIPETTKETSPILIADSIPELGKSVDLVKESVVLQELEKIKNGES